MSFHALNKIGPVARSLLDFRKEFFWVGVFSLVANLLTLSPTLYMLQVFDRVMQSHSELTLIGLTLIIAGFIAVMAFAEWVRARLLVRAGVRFDEQLNRRVFHANFESRLALSRSDVTQTFGALTRLRQFLTGSGILAFFDLPWTPIYLAVLFLMHPLLGWFGIVFTLLLALLAFASHRFSAHGTEQATKAEGEAIRYLSGKLRNVEVVEALGMLGNLKRRWLTLYRGQISLHAAAQASASQMQALSKFVQYSQQSLILALGAWLAIHGEITPGAMIASNVLMANALRPIGILVATWKEFIQARQALVELSKLLDTYPPRGAGHSADSVQGQITLHNLSAHAGQREQPILQELDLRFESGEVIGIVGPSGAGKSTLARCLVGIWPRTSGSVLLDGVDIRDWSRAALGPHIGYLPQDIELFDGTVADNICRFSEVDSERIIAAAKQADIHDMILRLAMGYDTPIGQAGRLLSGGQRQRLALARAIYGTPALVVLDEPNANLDDAGEAALASAISALKQAGKTVFMVLHQHKLLALADRVIIMAEGRITQVGKVEVQPLTTQLARARATL
jgi:ATP-binding cassette subfamily C exporter for protease/lipase